MRGDIGLIQLLPTRHGNAWIWRGGRNSTEGDPVRFIWGRWSENGDNYCIGGEESGETCGRVVNGNFIDQFYVNEGAWARNMVHGHKLGDCTAGGDSGGSVFTLYGDGVAAKGINSGNFVLGPSCDTYFTDIQNAIQPLPGTVKVKP